ncbi:MAG: metal-dependent hydrolase [Nanoarchaeota archaeon]
MLAFLFGIIGIKMFSISNQILFIVFVLIAGIFPDIDHPKSKIGRIFKPFSYLFSHRGFTHSLLVLPVISLILYKLEYYAFALPILIGYKSHLLGDAITKEGIRPLHPISQFRISGFIKTGGILENIIFVVLFFVSAYYLLNS